MAHVIPITILHENRRKKQAFRSDQHLIDAVVHLRVVHIGEDFMFYPCFHFVSIKVISDSHTPKEELSTNFLFFGT